MARVFTHMSEAAVQTEPETEMAAVQAAIDGRREEFDDLVARETPWVRGVVWSVLGDVDVIDDAVQQVWLQFWKRRGELAHPDRWRGWLYRLARNTALDAGRGSSRRRSLARSVYDQIGGMVRRATPGTELLADERQRIVRRAIESLPQHYREVLVLRHLEELSYREIAERLEVPVDTVETRLVRARRRLRGKLRRSGIHEERSAS